MNIKTDSMIVNGQRFMRFEFETFEHLEEFFTAHVLGQSDIRSEVIGKVLIWRKDKIWK